MNINQLIPNEFQVYELFWQFQSWRVVIFFLYYLICDYLDCCFNPKLLWGLRVYLDIGFDCDLDWQQLNLYYHIKCNIFFYISCNIIDMVTFLVFIELLIIRNSHDNNKIVQLIKFDCYYVFNLIMCSNLFWQWSSINFTFLSFHD